MNWIQSIHEWRRLPAAEKLRHRWQAIPRDVAQSMAFEREPVEIRRLQELLDQIGTLTGLNLGNVHTQGC